MDVLVDSQVSHFLPGVTTAVAFDTQDDCFFAASDGGNLNGGGTLACFGLPSGERYSFLNFPRTRSWPILSLLPLGGSVLSVSSASLRVYSVGGLLRLSRDVMEGCSCGVLASPSQHLVVLGRAAPDSGLQWLDVVSGASWSVSTTSGVTCLAQGGRVLAAGLLSGAVALLDPRGRAPSLSDLSGHGGRVLSIAQKGDLLASTGMAYPRGGNEAPEQLVRLWDVRSVARPVSSLPSTGCTLLAFLPRYSATLLLAGRAPGVFTCVDAGGAGLGKVTHVRAAGMLTSVCAAASGDAIALGCDAGGVHLVLSVSHPTSCDGATPLVLPYPRAAPAVYTIGAEQARVPRAPVDVGDGRPLLSTPVGTVIACAPPRRVSIAVLSTARDSEFLKTAPSPFAKRGVTPEEATRLAAPLRAARVARAGTSTMPRGGGEGACRCLDASCPCVSELISKPRRLASPLPAMYHYTSPSVSSSTVREGDFTTRLSLTIPGLEGDGCDGDVVAPLVLCLFYSHALRSSLLRHLCDVHTCLACELAFTFENVQRASPGVTARTQNFLRALRATRETAALGLLEGAPPEVRQPLVRRCPALYRFILESIGKDSTVAADTLFGTTFLTNAACTTPGCGYASQRETRVLVVDLVVPVKGERIGEISFSAVLESSFAGISDGRQWCEHEKGFTRTHSRRQIRSLAHTLALAPFGSPATDADAQLAAWRIPAAARIAGAAAAAAALAREADMNLPAHAYDPVETARLPGAPWLPLALRVTIAPSGVTHVQEGPSAADLPPSPHPRTWLSALYELSACCAVIRPRVGEPEETPLQPGGSSAGAALRRREGHVVTHIRVRPLDQPPQDGASTWVLFNGARVTPTAADEVGTLYGCSKLPVLLVFERVLEATQLPPEVPHAQLVPDALYARLSRARVMPPNASWTPLDLNAERPKKARRLCFAPRMGRPP